MGKVTKYIIIPEGKPLWAMQRIWGPTTGPLARPTKAPLDVIHDLLMQKEPNDITVNEVKPMKFDRNGQPCEFAKAVRLTLENYTLPYDEIAGIVPPLPKKSIEESRPKDKTIEPTIVKSPKKDESTKTATVVTTTSAYVDEKTGKAVVESRANEVPEVPDNVATSGYIAPIVDDDKASIEDTSVVTTTASTYPDLDADVVVKGDSAPEEEVPAASDEEPVERAENVDVMKDEDQDNNPLISEEPEGVVKEVDPYAGMSNKQRKRAMREAAARKAAEEEASINDDATTNSATE